MPEENDFLQTDKNRDKNSDWFLKNLDNYSESVSQMDTYQQIREALTLELRGLSAVLDVGNGGVFDYDTSVATHITGLDLFLDQLPKDLKIPSNVTMVAGDALSIPRDDNSFDGVVMVMLLHHLVGATVNRCISNLERSISEAHRVLRPGGKLVIVESCIPQWFYQFEKVVFPLATFLINKFLTHPPTLQYDVKHISSIIRDNFKTEPTIKAIPLGKFVLQYGFKWPTALTPVQPFLLTATKQ